MHKHDDLLKCWLEGPVGKMLPFQKVDIVGLWALMRWRNVKVNSSLYWVEFTFWTKVNLIDSQLVQTLEFRPHRLNTLGILRWQRMLYYSLRPLKFESSLDDHVTVCRIECAHCTPCSMLSHPSSYINFKLTMCILGLTCIWRQYCWTLVRSKCSLEYLVLSSGVMSSGSNVFSLPILSTRSISCW